MSGSVKVILRRGLCLVPDALSVFRLGACPVLIWLAWAGRDIAFFRLLLVSWSTDLVDGPLARRLGVASVHGARMDSWADFWTYASLPVCGWLLWPQVIVRELPFVGVAVLSYLVPVIIGLIRYRRLTAYHTYMAKITAVAMGLSVLVLFAGWAAWPFRIATGVAVLAGAEEVWITLLLREWRAQVPSVLTALEMRKGR